MAIEGKRIAKNTGILYFRMMFLMAVNLYTSRLLLSALGVVDYGLYNVVGGVVLMLGFLRGTMSTASARFVNVTMSKGDFPQLKKVFSSILLINIFLALLVVLFAETIGLWFLLDKMTIPEDRVAASFWVYQFSIVSVALSIVTVPYNATIIAHERMGAFAYISIFDAIAKLLIVYLLVVSPFDRLVFYALLILLVQIIDIVIYFIYCLKKFPETKCKIRYEKTIVKEIFSFIVWASYGSFVSVGYTQGLNIILNLFFGPIVNAARGIAVQVQHAVLNFTTNFQTAINPQLMKSTAELRFADTQKLLIVSSKFSFFLLSALCLPLIVETPFVLKLWLKEVPEYSVSFCRIILIISSMETLANPLRIINHAEGNIKKFQLYECTLLLLIMPISYILLLFYHFPILVFVVHLVIEVSAHFVRVAIVAPKIKMTFFSYIKNIYLRIIPVYFLPILFSFVIQSFLIHFNDVCRFIFVVLLSEIILMAFIALWGLTKEEYATMKSYVLKFVRK